MVEEAWSRWALNDLSNWDFSIFNHRNKEEEVRRRCCVEGTYYESAGGLRVLLESFTFKAVTLCAIATPQDIEACSIFNSLLNL